MNQRKSGQLSTKTRNPKVTLRQLRHAVIAADFGSFRQAAEACFVKQCTLSRSIQQLEALVGTAIFERSTAGIRPTAAGRSFLRLARSMLDQADTLVATTHANGRGDVGRLAIGFWTSLTTGNLRASLLDYRSV
ncbi:MAG: hypothetical protein CFE29_30630 [Bradyrhizobiaceae bacterium PARB1]|nr:MAG: hypothetical protein CFE29_30630 [Bradyrhizobiaceae bacterium PARB1]